MDFSCLQEYHDALISYLREHGYVETYVGRYRTVISQIVTNAVDHFWDSYADVFHWYSSQPYRSSYLREVQAVLGKLERFHLYGAYPDAKASASSFWKNKASYHQLSPEYKAMVDYYGEVERQRGLQATTIYSGQHKSASFLRALQNKGEDTLKAVTEASVLSCFYENCKQIRGAACSQKIKAFLRTCRPLNPMQCERIIRFIPELRMVRRNISYLSKEECERIRAAIDDYANGLRYKDRAVGLLLLYTGMRGGDIAGLQLSSIDWGNDRICFVQQKTQEKLVLPLTTIVGNAIYDYCVHERPRLGNPSLFLSCSAPHASLTTDGIGTAVERIMKKAGVRQYAGARKGTHIFRHHVATALLENGVPQPVISSTLGHAAPYSLEPYLYADFTHLKECALSVGQFPVAEGVLINV